MGRRGKLRFELLHAALQLVELTHFGLPIHFVLAGQTGYSLQPRLAAPDKPEGRVSIALSFLVGGFLGARRRRLGLRLGGFMRLEFGIGRCLSRRS